VKSVISYSMRVAPVGITVRDPLFNLEGQVVVLTGGAGLLGRCFADALAERGARVAIFDRYIDSMLTVGHVKAYEVDVTKRASLEAALVQVENSLGEPRGLINCAAIDSPPDAPESENGPFEEYSIESWRRVMDVNVTGTFLACQVVGGRMASRAGGSVVNIASIYGQVSPDQRIYEYRRAGGESFYKPAAYATSKSALYNLTRYLATYWANRGVRVNTVTFGGVFDNQDPQFLSEYAKRVPLGRMADPQDYVGTIIFLLSPASSYMTGSNVVIDGGWTAW